MCDKIINIKQTQSDKKQNIYHSDRSTIDAFGECSHKTKMVENIKHAKNVYIHSLHSRHVLPNA